MEPKISVIIPSRLEGSFLDDAVRSVFAQEGFHLADIQIIVGIDHGQAALFRQRFPDLDMAESTGHSQAAALNAAAKQARGKYLAFLEDDDIWERNFLHTVLPLLDEADFVSSTQLEIDEQGVVRRINDFPTPSGWVLHRNTFDAVGPFDESYRWHLDNDWLGRLGETNIRRIHMVESYGANRPGAHCKYSPMDCASFRSWTPTTSPRSAPISGPTYKEARTLWGRDGAHCPSSGISR